jgi:hypothetical protein
MQYVLILFGWLTAVGIYQSNKPLPEGLNYRSEKIQQEILSTIKKYMIL